MAVKTIKGATPHSTGVTLGSSASDPVSLHGATPIAQAAVAAAAGANPTAAEFLALLTALENKGIISIAV